MNWMTSIHMLGRSVVRLECVSLYGLRRNLSGHKEAHSGTGHAWRTNEPYIYFYRHFLIHMQTKNVLPINL